MWRYYNPNPAGRMVGDCSVRAVSAALDVSWDEAFDMVADMAKEMCDMPSSDAVWGAVLRQHGFVRSTIPNTCPDCYTIGDFTEDFPFGTYVLGTGGPRGHCAGRRGPGHLRQHAADPGLYVD